MAADRSKAYAVTLVATMLLGSLVMSGMGETRCSIAGARRVHHRPSSARSS
jgi:glycerol dehydrogenase-like iron-containing ADH family enzyme